MPLLQARIVSYSVYRTRKQSGTAPSNADTLDKARFLLAPAYYIGLLEFDNTGLHPPFKSKICCEAP